MVTDTGKMMGDARLLYDDCVSCALELIAERTIHEGEVDPQST